MSYINQIITHFNIVKKGYQSRLLGQYAQKSLCSIKNLLQSLTHRYCIHLFNVLFWEGGDVIVMVLLL